MQWFCSPLFHCNPLDLKSCVLEENTIGRFWFIAIAYTIYVSALILQNAVLAANDKAVLALGDIARWYVAVPVFLLVILLELGFEFYSKRLEEM